MADNHGYKFVFVHGAGHGAWCWYKVVNKIKQAAHSAATVDLTSAGINPVDPNEISTLAAYSQPLVDLINSIPDGDKVILVAHSMGGLTLTYIMEHCPEKCAAAIFVAASMYPSGSKAMELQQKALKVNDTFIGNVDFFYKEGSDIPTSAQVKMEVVQDVFYHLCPLEDVELAKMLLKPSPRLPPNEVCVKFTQERYGQVPRFYIKTMEDRIITPHIQDMYIENSPPKQVLELASDHSPFFCMPDALVDLLLQIASSLNA